MKQVIHQILYYVFDKIASLIHLDLQELVDHRLGIMQYRTLEESGEKYFIEVVLPVLWGCEDRSGVVIDVGSNEGEYTQLVLGALPEVQVHCFEPNPRTADRLDRRYQQEPRVEVNRLALGVSTGTVELFDYKDNEGSGHASVYRSVLTEQHQAAGVVSATVPVTTLDAYCKEQHLCDVFLLKIDVEGHELAALCGARVMLASHKISVIHFEFNEMNVISKSFLRDFYEILQGYAFYRLRFDGLVALGSYSPRNEIFRYQNIIAIQERLVPSVQSNVVRWVW